MSLGKKTCFDLQEAVSHTAADMGGDVLRAAGVKMSNGKWESSVSMETSIKVWTPNRAALQVAASLQGQGIQTG